MSTIDERKAYLNNPFFTKHLYGNFSPFYVTIAVCSIILFSILLLNVVLACCSKHRKYWQDRHTGNRWLVSIWSATPHLQPPLDLTELKDASHFQGTETRHIFNEDVESVPIHQPQHHIHHERPPRPTRQRDEYVELQKPVAMFIVFVIIIMLRFGPQLCGLRHHALPDNHQWHSDEGDWRGEAYDHEISLA